MPKYITASDFPQLIQDRFWKLVTIAGSDDCWLWNGAKDGKGYGRYYYCESKYLPSHRLTYAFTHGEIAAEMEVCHSCDNPPCCNPAHLFKGTHQDNMTDMVTKGRLVGLKGERGNSAKLKESQVLEIRRLYATGEYSHLKLAHMFGLSEAGARAIIVRKTWTHI